MALGEATYGTRKEAKGVGQGSQGGLPEGGSQNIKSKSELLGRENGT